MTDDHAVYLETVPNFIDECGDSSKWNAERKWDSESPWKISLLILIFLDFNVHWEEIITCQVIVLVNTYLQVMEFNFILSLFILYCLNYVCL